MLKHTRVWSVKTKSTAMRKGHRGRKYPLTLRRVQTPVSATPTAVPPAPRPDNDRVIQAVKSSYDGRCTPPFGHTNFIPTKSMIPPQDTNGFLVGRQRGVSKPQISLLSSTPLAFLCQVDFQGAVQIWFKEKRRETGMLQMRSQTATNGLRSHHQPNDLLRFDRLGASGSIFLPLNCPQAVAVSSASCQRRFCDLPSCRSSFATRSVSSRFSIFARYLE